MIFIKNNKKVIKNTRHLNVKIQKKILLKDRIKMIQTHIYHQNFRKVYHRLI